MKKRWNVNMGYKKLIIIMSLFSIPLLVMSLHLISNSADDGTEEGVFFGINVSLSFMYDLVLYLIIFISMICIILFLTGFKKQNKVRKILKSKR